MEVINNKVKVRERIELIGNFPYGFLQFEFR